jgi:hypothetical protein
MKSNIKAPRIAGTKTTKAKSTRSKGDRKDDFARWNLRLYVAGQTPRSLTAFQISPAFAKSISLVVTLLR